ncbi:hypothetical protein [Streptomyces sp. ISL-100]|uniref:hypothetical protein n=1 Tax=Streptomyces sp. ISL-100 TaxID=2819173 RepID=UPI001BEA005E|nr:hypothetical protein [Streptomyces sp. ISL-100]MBT2399768.1 hypothetical protein [Streptomyces sp. ISL-100]
MEKVSWVHVDYDNRHWVPLPRGAWDERPWRDERDWAEGEAVTLLFYHGIPQKRKEIKRLSKLLAAHRQVFEEMNTYRETYLYFAHPSEGPLALVLWYGPAEGEREATLRKYARVESPDAMLPPQVEKFSTEGLGTGLHSRNHVQLDDQSVAMNLWYAFRSEKHGVDLIAFASSGDLGEISAAEPAINEFVQRIRLIDDESEL